MKWIPKTLSLICLWGAVAGVVVYIDPTLIRDIGLPGSYLPFYLLLTVTIWYTLALLTKLGIASMVMALTIVGGCILTMMQIMHWGLAAVLLLTLVIESWYIYVRHEKIHSANEQKNRSASL